MTHVEVEGIDYSVEGIEAIRTEMAELRNAMMSHWPDSIPTTVMLSHAIALLAKLAEITETK